MPNMAVGLIPTYSDDLGRAVTDVRFKIRGDKLQVSGFGLAPAGGCTGTGNLFTLRHAVAQYADGSTIRYPIDNPVNTITVVQAAVADGAVCVHVEGERWSFIPPNIVGAQGGNQQTYVVNPGFADKETGLFTYNSNIVGAGVNARYAIELSPTNISDAIRGCLTAPVVGTAPCSLAGGTTPRYLTVLANKLGGGQVARQAKVSDWGLPVRTCAAALYAVGFCVKYQGESYRNAHLVLP
ncbi:MAG: hypothetical protein SFY66_18665 [Oculatellaceae cyanobacterium bins.114]|nr:hypothetical protein [Oculatellaceae cyanobacterium bins.114]